MSGSGQKALFFRLSVPFCRDCITDIPCRAALFARRVAGLPGSRSMDIAILAQRRRFPIDLIGKDWISTESGRRSPIRTRAEAALPAVRCSIREELACLRMTSRSLLEKTVLREAGAGAAAVDRRVRGSTSTIL
jgi:hypothetical protein